MSTPALSQLISTTPKGGNFHVPSYSNHKPERRVGRTATTVNLAAALMLQGERAFCIDLDPQANL